MEFPLLPSQSCDMISIIQAVILLVGWVVSWLHQTSIHLKENKSYLMLYSALRSGGYDLLC